MKITKNTLLKWVLGVGLLLTGAQSAFALQCDGTIYIKPPSSWTMVTLEAGGMFPKLSIGPSGWYEAKAAAVGQGTSFRVNSAGTHYPAQWIDRNHYDIGNNESTATDAFTCADLADGSLYISQDPTDPTKTVFGPNPPDAKYFFVMIPPDYEDWMSSIPMISMDGGATGKPMTAVPDMCGWYSYVFFNEEISDNVVLFRDDDKERDDMIGLNGSWEIAEDATPIPLNMIFGTMSSDTLFFVPDEEQKDNDDGYYYSAADVGGIEGRCTYTMAAIIYDTDASLHPAFSCYAAGGEGCQYGAQGISAPAAQDAVNKCIGVTPGIVNPTLDPSVPQANRKPTLSAAGTTCFISDALFNQLFVHTPGVNEKSCFDMEFKRSADGKWEFDSDYYTSPGVTQQGGFYPVEQTTDAIILEADPTQTPVPAARKKRTAEGPVFYGPELREVDPVEGMPMIDILCNGPGWKGGHDCTGIFADGDGTTTFVEAALPGADCVFGWSCPDKKPAGWPMFGTGEKATPRWTANENAAGTGGRNQQFCFESHAKFTKKPGLRFNFRGDDDIWVFIDNKIAVDLGGTHLAAPGYVNVDEFEGLSGKLVDGNQYDLDIFFCDRRTTMSNVRIKTNMYIVQKTSIEAKGEKDPSNPASTTFNICYTKSGDGSCAAAKTGSDEEVKYCGAELVNSGLDISFTLVNGNTITSPAVAGVENVRTGVHKCGIDLTNPAAPRVDKDAMCGLAGGRYTLFVTIDGKVKKVATFRQSGEVDVLYADGIAIDGETGKPLPNGKHTLLKNAMGGELVPVYISNVAPAATPGSPLEMIPMDAVGVEYALDVNKLMKVYARTVDAEGNEKFVKIASGEKRAIGESGIDTVYVTVDMEDLQAPTTPFEIKSAGSKTQPMVVNFYLPMLSFVTAPDSTGEAISGHPKEPDGTYEELWLGSVYDLYLAVLKPNDDGTSYYPCTECNFEIKKGVQTSEKIDFAPAVFENGYAKISVVSTKEYRYDPTPGADNPATIVAEFNDYVKAIYSPIYFREPPVPSPRLADVFDTKGAVPAVEYKIPGPYFDMNQEYLDGIADSVAIAYHRAIHVDSLPSRVCVVWDSSSAEKHNPFEEGFSNIPTDTEILCNVLVEVTLNNLDCSNKNAENYCSNVITLGGLTMSKDVKTSGEGRVISYAEFKDKGKIVKQGFPGTLTDRIAPVPLRAEVRTLKNGDELSDYDSLVVIMSEPVSMVAEAANKKSALDFYLNSAIELPEADRFVSALGGTPHVVIAQNDPVLSVSDGKGRIKYMYQRGEVSPHVGDYVRLAGNLTNVLWSDEANIQVPGYDTLRTVADAAYHWNSPTAYNETMRLPSPWIPVVGDAEIAVSEQKFAHTGNAPAGKDVPAVTVNGYRTTTTKNEVFAAEGGRPGHFVKADMYALINGLPENERADLNLQNVYFSYDVEYFTNLGAYVAGKSGKIYCDDSKNAIKYFDGGLCTDAGMDRNFFIGWNMRSDKGREVGTGAYIVKLKSFVKLDKSGKEAKQEKTSVWGVKRSPEPNTDYLKTNEK